MNVPDHLVCLCGSYDLVFVESAPVEQILKDKVVIIYTEFFECKKCNFKILAEGQLDKLLDKIRRGDYQEKSTFNL